MIKRIAILLLAAASLAACHRRPLEDPSELVQIRVEVNVDAVCNVTNNIYNPHIPVPELTTDMMRVLLYNPRNKNLMSQSFITAKSLNEKGEEVLSGTLNISYGNFDVIVYNFDTPTTQVSSENNENSAVAYTNAVPESVRSTFSKAGNWYDGPINQQPDHLLVAREHNLRVSPHDSLVVIRTTARTIVDTYYLQVRVEGAKYAESATAVISGLSPSNLFGLDQRTTDPETAVYFTLQKSTDDNIAGENKDVLCALFNTFGKIPDAQSELFVRFNIVDIAGNQLEFEFDLNEIFKTEDAIERHWLLIDHTIVIPDPGVNPDKPSGGFQPVVDEWETEHGEIIL